MKKLFWILAIIAFAAPAAAQSIAGSTVTMQSPGEFAAGQTFDVVFEVCNNSVDYEWIAAVEFVFDACVTVNSGSVLYYDPDCMPLPAFNFVGNGNIANFLDGDAGYGEIYDGCCMLFNVNITVNCDANYEASVAWHLWGDIYGADPHELTGLIAVGPVPVESATWGTVKSLYR